jgi:hypothetical protein
MIKIFSKSHIEKLSLAKITHGLSRSSFYRRFVALKKRCENIKDKDYKHYGGRGIKCLWKSFEDFRDDMYESYEDTLTLDRINVNGHYCEENCRWVSRKEQARNRTNNKLILFEGKKKSVSEWAEFLNIERYIINNRLIRNWSISRALRTIPRIYDN